jgi:predicted phage tail protein
MIRGSGGIVGGGGGGKGAGKASSSPTEAPNSLQSVDYVRVLSVISEGQIEGFVSSDPLKDIYLDKTPIRNTDGTDNFEDFTTEYRFGAPTQSVIPGFNSIEETDEVNVEVRSDLSITRTVTNSLTNALKVIITVNSFQEIAESGDVVPVRVDVAFDISSGGGPFVERYVDSFNGKSSGPYRRSYFFDVSTGVGPWSIRVRRLTPDRDSSRFSDKIIFSSVTAVNWTGQTYPNTAVFASRFSAKNFNSIPEVSLRLKGIQIKVPHNYNPIAKTYSGLFNGSLTVAYSNNPAWVLYDILTDSRYGMGLPEETLDVYSFYDAGGYCDFLVPDGNGGFGPRFTFNAYISRAGGAYEILKSVLGSFNAQLYLENGSVTLIQDRPKDPLYVFSESNVIVEEDETGKLTKPPFIYETTAENNRYNSVLVTWDDPNEFYESKTILIQDQDDIDKYGYNPTEVTAFGCTDRAQAIRFGRWTLYTSLFQTKTVSFSVGKDGLYTRPGDIVLIQDRMRSPQRLAGRILEIYQVFDDPDVYYTRLDSVVTLDLSKSYTFQYVNSSGSLEEASVVLPTGTGTVVTDILYTEGTDDVDFLGSSYWLINVLNEDEAAQYRILNINEDPESAGTTYTITAVEHYPDKYALIENFSQSNLNLSIVSQYPEPNPPENLKITEALYATSSSAGVKVKVNISWSAPVNQAGIRGYEIAWRKSPNDGGLNFNSWNNNISPDTFFEIYDVESGLYDFQVLAVDIFGKRSKINRISQLIYGLTARPATVTGFRLSTQNAREGQANLSWDTAVDLDVLVNGNFIIKHYQVTDTEDWNKGVLVAKVAGSSNSVTVPLINGTYAIKAEDSTGNKSDLAAYVNTEFAGIPDLNNIFTLEEHPEFSGTKTNVFLNGVENYIELQDLSTTDSYVGLVDNILNWDNELTTGSFTASGIYEFSDVIDLGQVFNALVTLTFDAFVYTFDDLIDSVLTNIDSLQQGIDNLGSPNDEASVTPQIALSNDGTTYSPWGTFYSGYYKARYYKFRLLLETSESSVNVRVSELGVIVDVPDTEAEGSVTTSASNDVIIEFPENLFYTTPRLFFTVNDGEADDSRVVTDLVETGFSLSIYNASARVVRDVNWIAKGY